MQDNTLKELLELKYDQFNRREFIATDPVQIPHQYSRPEDIEIAAFLSATIAWGQRKSIIANAHKLMHLMGDSPYDFVMEADGEQLSRLDNFVHRTFQPVDCLYFIQSLRNIYQFHGGLKSVFESAYLQHGEMVNVLVDFRKVFFEVPGLLRTQKHIADVSRGASAKRLNMFLRWMVRNDGRGVDFGLWNKIPASALYLPLDLHTGNVARKLGLLTRKYDDWRAVSEVTFNLREFDPSDPVKYDYALFGLGVFEKLR